MNDLKERGAGGLSLTFLLWTVLNNERDRQEDIIRHKEHFRKKLKSFKANHLYTVD